MPAPVPLAMALAAIGDGGSPGKGAGAGCNSIGSANPRPWGSSADATCKGSPLDEDARPCQHRQSAQRMEDEVAAHPGATPGAEEALSIGSSVRSSVQTSVCASAKLPVVAPHPCAASARLPPPLHFHQLLLMLLLSLMATAGALLTGHEAMHRQKGHASPGPVTWLALMRRILVPAASPGNGHTLTRLLPLVRALARTTKHPSPRSTGAWASEEHLGTLVDEVPAKVQQQARTDAQAHVQFTQDKAGTETRAQASVWTQEPGRLGPRPLDTRLDKKGGHTRGMRWGAVPRLSAGQWVPDSQKRQLRDPVMGGWERAPTSSHGLTWASLPTSNAGASVGTGSGSGKGTSTGSSTGTGTRTGTGVGPSTHSGTKTSNGAGSTLLQCCRVAVGILRRALVLQALTFPPLLRSQRRLQVAAEEQMRPSRASEGEDQTSHSRSEPAAHPLPPPPEPTDPLSSSMSQQRQERQEAGPVQVASADADSGSSSESDADGGLPLGSRGKGGDEVGEGAPSMPGLQLPRSIEDLKRLHGSLERQVHAHPCQFVVAFSLLYVCLLTLTIPGATLLNVLAGALFGFLPAVLLLTLLITLGTLGSYCLSWLLLYQVLQQWMPARLEQLRSELAGQQQRLLSYLLFLRFSPVLPSWFVNVAAPLVGVPWQTFAVASALGFLPHTSIQVHAGCVLSSVNSLDDLYSGKVVALLFLLSLFSLVPIFMKANNSNVSRRGSRTDLSALH